MRYDFCRRRQNSLPREPFRRSSRAGRRGRIALDHDGNIWVAANGRNAIVGVTDKGKVIEVFRNAPNPATQLRNAGQNGGAGLLEFPTSPFLFDRKFCVTSSDGNRRDNSPNSAGEVNNPAGGPGQDLLHE